MRKDILQRLIDQCTGESFKDFRVKELKNFLALPEIQQRNSNEDISFGEFSDYLLKKHPQYDLARLFEQDFLNSVNSQLVVVGKPQQLKPSTIFKHLLMF